MITTTPFSISVHQDTYPDFDEHKDKLIAGVLERERTETGTLRSNQGGYQTQPNLGNDELFRPLLTFIAQSCDDILASYNIRYDSIQLEAAWANINRGQGSHNQMHIHDGILSGVFYLQAPEGSGKLNLVNPGMTVLWQGHLQSQQHNEHTAEAAHIIPKAGELFLWPSYVPHSVDCNADADCERISISFNVNVARVNA